MDLEKRVEALEQEVEILKNQIQATLLDIQEQILTNAYPSLRSGTSTTADGLRGPDETRPSPIKTFRPHEETGSDTPPMNGVTMTDVRKVSLDALDRAPAPAPVAESQAKPVDWSTMDELEEWLSVKVEKIGPERTRQLIHMYHENGRFEADMVDTLIRFVDLYDGESNRPFEVEQAARPSPPPAPQPRPSAAPKPQARPRKAVAGPRKAASTQQTTASPKPVVAPKTEHHEAAPADAAESKEPVSEERATVLRLIAGIYNAGAGVKWGKK